MIFYHIQASGYLGNIPLLLANIYHPENHYALSIDRAVNHLPPALVDLTARTPNITLHHEDAVCWGGASQVDVMLKFIEKFVGSDHVYYINLSDRDVPLWPQARLFECLGRTGQDGKRVFMQCWHQSDTELILARGDRTPRTAIHQQRPDIRFIVDAELDWMFKSVETSPITALRLRPAVSSYELRAERALYLQPLTPAQARERRSLFSRVGLFVGRQWMVLHREFAEAIISSEAFWSTANILRDIVIPDEAVFQTGMQAMGYDRRKLAQTNLRLWEADSRTVTDQDIPEIAEQRAAFVRAVDLGSNPAVLAWVRENLKDEIAAFAEMAGWSPFADLLATIVQPRAFNAPPA